MKPSPANASAPPGAPVTHKTAPNALAQPLGATVRLAFTESEAAKFGFLGIWQAARKRQADRIARKLRQAELKSQAVTELKLSVLKLFERAEIEEWGQRRLASETGIPQTTLRRIRAGQVDALAWLPKVQAAVSRITPE